MGHACSMGGPFFLYSDRLSLLCLVTSISFKSNEDTMTNDIWHGYQDCIVHPTLMNSVDVTKSIWHLKAKNFPVL